MIASKPVGFINELFCFCVQKANDKLMLFLIEFQPLSKEPTMRFSALNLIMLSFVFAVSFAFFAPPIKAVSSEHEWFKNEFQKRFPAIRPYELNK